MTQPIQLPQLPFHRQTPDGYKNDLELSPQAQVLVMEAEEMGIQWEVVPFTIVVKYTYNGHSEFVRHGVASTNRVPGPYICDDKYLTRAMLADAGLPIPKGYSIMHADTPEDRAKIFEALEKPLVVKPAYGTHGTGVKMGITTLEQMNAWTDHLFATVEKNTDTRAGMVLVEETSLGKEYRVLATRDKLVAVMHRRPASVTGDGVQTVEQLIAQKNQDPMRNISSTLYPQLSFDDDMMENLSAQSLNLASVPAKDQVVYLRTISNIMAGGDAVDVTDEVHPSVAEIAMRVAQTIPGMTLVGLDYITTNIQNDQQQEQHAIIEVNRSPEYAMHDLPMYGKKRGVGRTILQMLFPEWHE